jgi:amidophosphoribosyltransferase
MMMQGMLIGFRDPCGIRPLCLGKLENSYLLSSESCAFSALGAEFIRDVRPGEIIIIDKNGLHSFQVETPEESHLCIFEYVYFARADSYIDNASVHRSRLEAGSILAKESPVDADLVIGVPDSALSAALGFSRESGIAYGHALMRNRYVGRTFIQPSQNMRDAAVKIKFSPLENEIRGKRIVMIDDSIVRGTTTRIIVQMLKNAGAKEVHLRISSPPVKFPCYYGIDTANASQLIASRMSLEEIRRLVGADSLAYLSLEGLRKTPVGVNGGLCDACFTGNYCIPIEDEMIRNRL